MIFYLEFEEQFPFYRILKFCKIVHKDIFLADGSHNASVMNTGQHIHVCHTVYYNIIPHNSDMLSSIILYYNTLFVWYQYTYALFCCLHVCTGK